MGELAHDQRGVYSPVLQRGTNDRSAAQWPSDVREDVVGRYTAGEKLEAITRATGVPQATIFSMLQTAGVAPQRTRRKPTVVEKTDNLQWMLERMLAQERYVAALLAELERHGIDPPPRE